MSRALIPLTGVILMVASGILHGVQTGRWRDPEILSRAAERLEDVPRRFGSWNSHPLELSERQLEVAEAAGGVAARYETFDARTGSRAVEVMFLCGPFGPIAVHPPTVCFQGVGYRQLGEEKRVEVEDAAGKSLGTFWSTDFERTVDGVPQRIRTWWGWSDGGEWTAPQNPRFAFAGTPVLYKVYFTEDVSSTETPSVIPSFAQQFLPEVSESVFVEGS
ncbi:MAG: hypothetical protein WBC44_08205 [Planctomycetaceae bacterium]